MLGKKANNKIIFVKNSHKPSRHLVDLNLISRIKQAEKEPVNFLSKIFKREEDANILQTSNSTAGFIDEKKAGANSKYIRFFFPFAKDNTSNTPASRPDSLPDRQTGQGNRTGRFREKGILRTWHEKYFHKVERLAFFPLLKFLFTVIFKIAKIIYKLSYGIGWLMVFLARFFYLFVWRIAVFIFHLLTFFRFRPERISKRNKRKEIISPSDSLPHQEDDSSKDKNACENAAFFNPPAPLSKGGNEKDIKPSGFNLIKIIEAVFSVILLARILKKIIKRRQSQDEKDLSEERNAIGRKSLLKPALIFSVVLLIFVLPIKAYLEYKDLNNLRERVTGISQAAVSDIMTASQSAQKFDFGQASQELNNASANFSKAKSEIANISFILGILAKVIPNNDIKMAANADLVLEAGRLSADIGNKLMRALEKIPAGGQNDIKIFFDNLYLNLKTAAADAGKLQTVILKIDAKNLPLEYQNKFIAIKSQSTVITGSLNEVVDLLDKARIFLGFEADKRYLLVFQNNAEMRGSGGFVGSFALIDLAEGNIKNLEVPGGGSYDTEGGLLEKITAPEPLFIVNPLWHFWDANWWPDWPASARKLAEIYEKSGGPTVDGVISFTPTVMENLLAVIGPIDMTAKYGVILNKDNFWQETQSITEERYKLIESKEELIANETGGSLSTPTDENNKSASSSPAVIKNQPKKIIGDLIGKIRQELPKNLNQEQGIKLLAWLENSLLEKQIMFYFYDPVLENKVQNLGWDGGVKNTAKDYLMVVNANIAGGKSDRVIEEKIELTAEILSDGTIIDTVFIRRRHNGIKREKFTGVRNVDWLRVYAPAGSVLLEAGGFLKPDDKYFEQPDPAWQIDPDLILERQAKIDATSGTKIYPESGKTVFANWLMVDPGKTVTAYFKYRLPFKAVAPATDDGLFEKIGNYLNDQKKELIPYSLLAQKQPGSIGSLISSRLILPENFQTVWIYPDNLTVASGGWNLTDDLKTDKFWAVLIEPKK